jgi:hypothetical protein
MDGSDLTSANQQPMVTPRAGPRLTLLLVMLVLGVAAGAMFTAWIIHERGGWALPWKAAPPASSTPAMAPGPAVPVRQPFTAGSADAVDLVALRVSELEDRLARLKVEADAASGNAGRAEGLLVAFAARRALDKGESLGYLENQLRLRFGDAQPKAVATIINAAREPVTLPELEATLDDLQPSLVRNAPESHWWIAFMRELRELVVIRRASTPSPLAPPRMERAQRLLSAGKVDGAIAEIEQLPGRAMADRWLQMARRYNEARRALDLIEAAAVLQPVTAAPSGSPAQQDSVQPTS